jgi:hypothetical protein
MSLKAYWAYDFACDRALENMCVALNELGTWQWDLGDSADTRPTAGVRVRVHHYPQAGEGGVFVGRRASGYSALLQIEADSTATRSDIDETFRGLLNRAKATDVTAIEPYD